MEGSLGPPIIHAMIFTPKKPATIQGPCLAESEIWLRKPMHVSIVVHRASTWCGYISKSRGMKGGFSFCVLELLIVVDLHFNSKRRSKKSIVLVTSCDILSLCNALLA